MDVKKEEKKNIVKVNVLFVFFYECFFYDKIVKNKEEFNILICSRSRIMNLEGCFLVQIIATMEKSESVPQPRHC